jgi:hypothetical protein
VVSSADDDRSHPVLNAEEQLDEQRGTDELSDDVDKRQDDRRGRDRAADIQAAEAGGEDVTEGELTEVTQRLGDEEHREHIGDRDVDRVVEPVETTEGNGSVVPRKVAAEMKSPAMATPFWRPEMWPEATRWLETDLLRLPAQ